MNLAMQKEITALLEENSAELLAMQSALLALIATHHDRQALLAAFLPLMHSQAKQKSALVQKHLLAWQVYEREMQKQ